MGGVRQNASENGQNPYHVHAEKGDGTNQVHFLAVVQLPRQSLDKGPIFNVDMLHNKNTSQIKFIAGRVSAT